jgi:hypothetical protein
MNMKNKKRRLKIKKLPLLNSTNSPPNQQKPMKKSRFHDLLISRWWAPAGLLAVSLLIVALFLPERPQVAVAVAPPAAEKPPVCLRLNGYTVGDRVDTAHVAIDTALYNAASGNGQIVLQKQPLLTAQVRQHHIVELEQILWAVELEMTIQFVSGQLAQKPVFSATHAANNLSGRYHWRYGDVSVTLEQGRQKGKWTLRLKKAP